MSFFVSGYQDQRTPLDSALRRVCYVRSPTNRHVPSPVFSHQAVTTAIIYRFTDYTPRHVSMSLSLQDGHFWF